MGIATNNREEFYWWNFNIFSVFRLKFNKKHLNLKCLTKSTRLRLFLTRESGRGMWNIMSSGRDGTILLTTLGSLLVTWIVRLVAFIQYFSFNMTLIIVNYYHLLEMELETIFSYFRSWSKSLKRITLAQQKKRRKEKRNLQRVKKVQRNLILVRKDFLED